MTTIETCLSVSCDALFVAVTLFTGAKTDKTDDNVLNTIFVRARWSLKRLLDRLYAKHDCNVWQLLK